MPTIGTLTGVTDAATGAAAWVMPPSGALEQGLVEPIGPDAPRILTRTPWSRPTITEDEKGPSSPEGLTTRPQVKTFLRQ